ncbi:hypothetical protein AVL50_24185 [Flammeovirga sp. SJP92]|nr:hypothetical protein AVL50_24185 [Flammeovirga sp. SJP92]
MQVSKNFTPFFFNPTSFLITLSHLTLPDLKQTVQFVDTLVYNIFTVLNLLKIQFPLNKTLRITGQFLGT